MTAPRVRMWRSYFESSVLLQQALDDRLRAASGLSMMDYNVLLLLAEAPERRLRMGDLARAMVFSSSRLSYEIGVLERRGLVCRERAASDARVIHACLTDSGKKKFDQAGRAHLTAVRELFLDDLDDAQTAVLEQVFTRLGGKLQDIRNNSNLK